MINQAQKYIYIDTPYLIINDEIKNAKAMTSKLTEIDGQINDVNNQHTETKRKIKELEKIKKPNLFEQEQLDGLIKTNDEFERKLRWHILIHKFC